MLTWRRQACYWALSLVAVLAFKLLPPPSTTSPSNPKNCTNTSFVSITTSQVNGTTRYTVADDNNTYSEKVINNGTFPISVEPCRFDCGGLFVWTLILAIVLACCLQDAHVTREESIAKFARRDGLAPENAEVETKIQWPTSFTYYPILGAVLVCTGYVAHRTRQVYGYGNLWGSFLEQELVHLHLAFILLAEMEYWRLGTQNVYLYKTILFAWEYDTKEILKQDPTGHVVLFWVGVTIFVYITRFVTGNSLWGLEAMLSLSGIVIMIAPVAAIPLVIKEEAYKCFRKREKAADVELGQV